jgi:hypothetical protein
MNLTIPKLCPFASRVGSCLMVAALFLLPAVNLLASGPGPNGVNVGFNFDWLNNGPAGYTATFLQDPNTGTLNTCSSICNFAITYSVGGVPQPAVAPNGTYNTWTPPGSPPPRICDVNPANTSPLTLFNCFNSFTFGQHFTPTNTGLLSGMTMPMTCLNPAGTPPTGLVALLYSLPGINGPLPATPLAQVPVDLSTCPTLTDWTGHTFSAADFASIPLNFPSVTLTSGQVYGVYFAGLEGQLPEPVIDGVSSKLDFASYKWKRHCRGLYQTPIAA